MSDCLSEKEPNCQTSGPPSRPASSSGQQLIQNGRYTVKWNEHCNSFECFYKYYQVSIASNISYGQKTVFGKKITEDLILFCKRNFVKFLKDSFVF